MTARFPRINEESFWVLPETLTGQKLPQSLARDLLIYRANEHLAVHDR